VRKGLSRVEYNCSFSADASAIVTQADSSVLINFLVLDRVGLLSRLTPFDRSGVKIKSIKKRRQRNEAESEKRHWETGELVIATAAKFHHRADLGTSI